MLFRHAPPAVDALIQERRRTGVDRLDEVWDGVYVVNPPPSFRHATVARLIAGLFDRHAEARGLVVRWEVGVGRPSDHRIPDVVVGRVSDLDGREHYLLSAEIAVEVLSPTERVDKLPFYRTHGVTEVVLVDLAAGTVKWLGLGPDGADYRAITASTVLPLGSEDILALL